MSNMDFDVKGNQAMDFFLLEEVLLWIMVLSENTLIIYLCLAKTPLCFTRCQLMDWSCGLLWCFYQLEDCHSNGTHSLQRIHCWASNAMLNYSKSFVMKKTLFYIFDDQGFRKVSVFILFLNDWLTTSQLKIDWNMWRFKSVEMLNKSWLN